LTPQSINGVFVHIFLLQFQTIMEGLPDYRADQPIGFRGNIEDDGLKMQKTGVNTDFADMGVIQPPAPDKIACRIKNKPASQSHTALGKLTGQNPFQHP